MITRTQLEALRHALALAEVNGLSEENYVYASRGLREVKKLIVRHEIAQIPVTPANTPREPTYAEARDTVAPDEFGDHIRTGLDW